MSGSVPHVFMTQGEKSENSTVRITVQDNVIHWRSIIRIPPCPPLIFHRNIFAMSILRFLFEGTWGKYWENNTTYLLQFNEYRIYSKLSASKTNVIYEH